MKMRRKEAVRGMSMLVVPCVVALVSFVAGFVVASLWPSRPATLGDLFGSPLAAAWAGAIVNFAVVFVAVFLSILRESYRRARLHITYGTAAPHQVVGGGPGRDAINYVRLKVRNIGRRVAGACEVRIERIYAIHADNGRRKLVPRADHDPRPLKWVGRGTGPIPLSPGAFDLVDLGAQTADYMQNFRLEFFDRGHLDLDLSDPDVSGFQLEGSVYGEGAVPLPFAFVLTWRSAGDLMPVDIREA